MSNVNGNKALYDCRTVFGLEGMTPADRLAREPNQSGADWFHKIATPTSVEREQV